MNFFKEVHGHLREIDLSRLIESYLKANSGKTPAEVFPPEILEQIKKLEKIIEENQWP